MINISSLVPNVEDLLKRSAEELAYPMLKLIDSLRGIDRHRQNLLITPGITSGYPPEYESRVLEVLNEEWEWLRAKGYIGPQRENPNPDFIDITRAGRKFLQNYEGEHTQARGRGSSGKSASGEKPDSIFPQVIESAEALGRMSPWVRAVIAARCAARVLPLFLPAHGRPKDEARADIKAVGLCWKLAALAANVGPQKDPLVSKVVQAVVAAVRAIADERNPATEAAGVATMAASISQRPLPEPLQGLLTAYKRGFARLAEGEEPEWVAIRNAAMGSLREDLMIAGRLSPGRYKESPLQINQLTQRLLWGAAVVEPVQALDRILAPWHMRLIELDMPDEYAAYVGLITGSRQIDFEELQREVNKWASEANMVGSSGIDYVKLDAKIVEPPTIATRPTLRMLADIPIEDETADLLGFKAYAHALAGLMDNPETKTPLTLAINAPWGAGKTSLARMVRTILERKPEDKNERHHVTCWFDAWMHDDAPNLASAFAAEVARTADRCRSRWRRFVSPVPIELLSISERGSPRVRLFLLVVTLSLFCLAEWYFPRTISLAAGWVALSLGLAAVTVITSGEALRLLGPVARAVASFVRSPYATARDASMKEVSSQLGQLIAQATKNKSKFVIFVDDLERCRPPRAVDVLEVVNQLLNHEGIVTVVMGDMSAIAACAEVKYKQLARPKASGHRGVESEPQQSYGREYLDKIIQLQFDLPPYSAATIQEFVGKVSIGRRPGAQAKRSVLTRLLRGVLRVPKGIWDRRRVGRARQTIPKKIEAEISSGQKDFATIQRKLADFLQGTLPPQEVEDLTRQGVQRRLGDESELMEQAAEFLGYVDPYPRHAKRFLNRLRLLLYIAHERGIFSGELALTPRHVAKWAVLCERWPLLATALSAHPHMMIHLEPRPAVPEARGENYVNPLSWLAPEYMGDSWLPAFLASEPKIAGVIGGLIRFEPATRGNVA